MKDKKKPEIRIIEVCREENRLIKLLRNIRYGEVTITVRHSKPHQVLESKKSILLSEDSVFNEDNNINA